MTFAPDFRTAGCTALRPQAQSANGGFGTPSGPVRMNISIDCKFGQTGWAPGVYSERGSASPVLSVVYGRRLM